MKLINLTPHDITLLDSNNVVKHIIPSSGVARVDMIDSSDTSLMLFDGIDVVVKKPSKTRLNNTLPALGADVMYIVSRPVFDTANTDARGASDLLTVGDTVRDGSTILGCKNLIRA